MTDLLKPVSRRSAVTLDRSFGPDHSKRIVVTILPNGTLQLRPERTRRPETIALLDVYRYALRCRVNAALLQKARDTKARNATRLAKARQERAEARLTRP